MILRSNNRTYIGDSLVLHAEDIQDPNDSGADHGVKYLESRVSIIALGTHP